MIAIDARYATLVAHRGVVECAQQIRAEQQVVTFEVLNPERRIQRPKVAVHVEDLTDGAVAPDNHARRTHAGFAVPSARAGGRDDRNIAYLAILCGQIKATLERQNISESERTPATNSHSPAPRGSGESPLRADRLGPLRSQVVISRGQALSSSREHRRDYRP